MLPTSLRLSLRHIPDFFAQAHRRHTEYFTVFIGPAVVSPQVAVVVPAKHTPKSVDRNLIKRRLRQAVTQAAPHLPARQLVIAAKAAASTASVSDFTAALERPSLYVPHRH